MDRSVLSNSKEVVDTSHMDHEYCIKSHTSGNSHFKQMTFTTLKSVCKFCSALHFGEGTIKTSLETLLMKHCHCKKTENENFCCTD